jgi:small subunit ribosomal protein S10
MAKTTPKDKQAAYKIRVRLKSYDHRVIDDAAKKILDTAVATGANIIGPVPLPTHIKAFAVLTSPHSDKNAQEHYEIRTHKRLIDIINPTSKTIDSLLHLELPAGVDIQIKM